MNAEKEPINGEQPQPLIPCVTTDEKRKLVQDYAAALQGQAHLIGAHGLSHQEFDESGLFQAAIESLRGTTSASMADKRAFVRQILNHLQSVGEIDSWKSSEGRDRHDYEVHFADGRTSVIEAKGCLDGNNTNIFTRPRNADEFVIWSLCQNSGADMAKNVWSGIHVRLGPEMIAENKHVDGLVVWDALCGTAKRPCPKLAISPDRRVQVKSGQSVPPPCIYLFPRTVPDYRNNPNPATWALGDIRILSAIGRVFGCVASDISEVRYQAGHTGQDVTMATAVRRQGGLVKISEPKTIRRAKG